MSCVRAFVLCAAAVVVGAGPATAQAENFYAGRTLNVLVGVAVGGTVDTMVRRSAPFLKQHLQGSPTVVVQNMTGGGSNLEFNYLAEKATPDGLTIVYSECGHPRVCSAAKTKRGSPEQVRP